MPFEQHLEAPSRGLKASINIAEELDLDVDRGVDLGVESDVDLAPSPRAQR